MAEKIKPSWTSVPSILSIISIIGLTLLILFDIIKYKPKIKEEIETLKISYEQLSNRVDSLMISDSVDIIQTREILNNSKNIQSIQNILFD